MPLKIDISDATVEKHESMHELHLWGLHTALWKNNCIVCGKDTNANRIRCSCGDGFYCTRYCQQHPAAHPEKQCLFLSCAPLKSRPTPRHRRAVVFQSGEPNLCVVWAEIEGSHVIIDHPALDECYRGANGTDKPWVDLAVINPVTDGSELFQKIGHGIAIGFPSTTMEPRSDPADASQRNTGVMDITPPGHRSLWPGPLIFFCYGYDMSDYVKVDPSEPENVESGAEAAMTKLDIWNELDGMR